MIFYCFKYMLKMDSNVGHHCYKCGIQTYLPIECIFCSLDKNIYFCRDHIHDHDCQKKKEKSKDQNILKKKRNKKKRCNFESCKKRINIFNFKCTYCDFLYCVDHQLPEIHLCGKFQTINDEMIKRRKKELEENQAKDLEQNKKLKRTNVPGLYFFS